MTMMTRLWRSGQPLAVRTDDNAVPSSFEWNGRVHCISGICNHWRVHHDWWRCSPIWRDYYKIVTTDGFLCVIYRDLVTDTWYLARIYD